MFALHSWDDLESLKRSGIDDDSKIAAVDTSAPAYSLKEKLSVFTGKSQIQLQQYLELP